MAIAPANFSLSGFLKIIRYPNLIIIVLSQYMVAIFLVGPKTNWQDYLMHPGLFAMCFSTVLIAAAGYIINDYYDVKIDLINKPGRVIVGKILKRRVVMVWHTVFNILGVGVGLMAGWKIAAINFFAAFLLWLYSNQLKRLPFIGNMVVSLLTCMSILVVSIYFRQSHSLIFIYAFFAFSFTLIREIIKDMEDLRGDATHGCITLPIIWGIRKTKLLLYAIILVLFIFMMFFLLAEQNVVITAYFSLLALPFLYFMYKLVMADSQKSFAELSLYCKLFMLSGILSISFF